MTAVDLLPWSGMSSGSIAGRPAILGAGGASDEATYRRMVEPHRRELHAHCYRMLGSVHDADDALQEAMLRAWRGLARFEGRSSLRSWLYRIATNTCLDAIARRRGRVLPVDHRAATDAAEDPGEPLAESVWVEPYPDERLGVEDGFAAPEARYERRESVELAFIAALQHLPARQRAVLILREVLGFSAREVAAALETTTASVNSALQRARATVEERLPERTQQTTLRALGDERVRELVERYVDAWEQGDVDAVVGMLAEDATFSMPPLPTWYRGRDAIASFLPRGPLAMRRRFIPVRANAQLAFGTYRWDAAEGGYVGNAVHLLTLRGARIADVTAFLTPEVFPTFGLPARPPSS
jgi:RNA polymerase sigma-70 factor, ECF subfamily